MGREGQGHVTHALGAPGHPLLVRQLHRGGWTALSGVLVTRPGPEWAAAGACGPRVTCAGWSQVTYGPGPVKGKPYVLCGRECYRNGVAWR